MDIVSLWDKTLQLIKGELSPPSFNAFFNSMDYYNVFHRLYEFTVG